MIQVLTATGARPEAWSRCNLWMRRQDYPGQVRWIIVDDGHEPSRIDNIPGWMIMVVRPKPCWRLGQNTQVRNIREALKFVNDDEPLLIVEDDDHYKPGWISRAVAELGHHDLVGQKLCRKYSVGNMRARELKEPELSSLCSTAMIGKATRKFRDIALKGPRLMDCALWREWNGHLFDGDYVTSIKCMPGRGGIDSGHKPNFGDIEDLNGELLRHWIGKDVQYYTEFMR